jgi:hypothetical protein
LLETAEECLDRAFVIAAKVVYGSLAEFEENRQAGVDAMLNRTEMLLIELRWTPGTGPAPMREKREVGLAGR